jgi:hypothetical protein
MKLTLSSLSFFRPLQSALTDWRQIAGKCVELVLRYLPADVIASLKFLDVWLIFILLKIGRFTYTEKYVHELAILADRPL